MSWTRRATRKVCIELSEGRINILGVGNTLMGDDGVGTSVIEALGTRELPANVRLYDAGLAVSDVITLLEPEDRLIIVDAMRGGGVAGDVYRGRLDEMDVSRGSAQGAISLHEVSVLPALTMERLSGREFRDVTIFGVEPGAVEWGEGLSEAVASSVGRVVEAVLEEAAGAEAVIETGESE